MSGRLRSPLSHPGNTLCTNTCSLTREANRYLGKKVLTGSLISNSYPKIQTRAKFLIWIENLLEARSKRLPKSMTSGNHSMLGSPSSTHALTMMKTCIFVAQKKNLEVGKMQSK